MRKSSFGHEHKHVGISSTLMLHHPRQPSGPFLAPKSLSVPDQAALRIRRIARTDLIKVLPSYKSTDAAYLQGVRVLFGWINRRMHHSQNAGTNSNLRREGGICTTNGW